MKTLGTVSRLTMGTSVCAQDPDGLVDPNPLDCVDSQGRVISGYKCFVSNGQPKSVDGDIPSNFNHCQ